MLVKGIPGDEGASVAMLLTYPDSKFHGANMGPTWVLSAPGGLQVGLMNLVIWIVLPEYSSFTTRRVNGNSMFPT